MQVYSIRIKTVKVFIPFSAKFQKGGVADKIRMCRGTRDQIANICWIIEKAW